MKSFKIHFYEETCSLVSAEHLKAFETFVDRLFKKYDLDFEFTKHFRERLSDNRNDPCIKMKELADFLQKIYNKKGNPLKGLKGTEAVITDMQSDLNIPLVVKYDAKNDEFDVVMKTIMRKKNFKTPDKKIIY